ncbi:acetoin dehydrogenase [Alteromonas lipolytica]|uniref:Acetoin dehydrogenase n=2 Tax=Alteromonas lipolytica TaxID=1856405 RepID=A0A1E8FFT3_9ALTE|nr:acetoin dehydrogenase [Alteromonas lipolytica]GGF52363.1 acetoin dehydrogenase [Alteromonas lipolytica]
MQSNQTTTFAEQINQAQHQAMQDDPAMLAFGLGISDPKGIFGTTTGLAESFGHERVFDMPTAENGMTGIGIGAALAGSRVLMTHQRLDFFLLAMDQLVNNAAKWHYMFNGQMKVPLTIRLIIGRGWGQGPTHAQNLQSWFAHIPGLKVITPSKTDAVAAQLYSAIMDDSPVIFIEHRWLHQQQCETSQIKPLTLRPEPVRVHKTGADYTIVANSYMVLESLIAARKLAELGIDAEVLETAELEPACWQPVYQSVAKTGRLLVCDSAHTSFSVAAEIISSVTERCFGQLKQAPLRLGLPDYPEPTSIALTKHFYPSADSITKKVMMSLQRELPASIQDADEHHSTRPHDVPGEWFKGPF